MKRRDFIRSVCVGTCGVVGGATLPFRMVSAEKGTGREADHYEKMADGKVHCLVCPRSCVVPEGHRGFCRVRENIGGNYYLVVYGKTCAAHIDPIEKKPLFHFLPGTEAFSIATVGCNMACKFCQNWEISQARPEEVHAAEYSPEDIARSAVTYKTPTIAYTYTEPIVWNEYVRD